jgi:transcription elongation factor B subunit 2
MDVFLMIRRKNQTIFTDTKDSATVKELKQIIEGILKVAIQDQRLIKDNQIMSDDKQLQDYNITVATAKGQSPAEIGLCLRLNNGDFEELDVVMYSTPPDLPDVMKNPEAMNGQESSS